jgi:hypothetical protein
MKIYRPSRIYVIGVYIKRLVRWRRLSWPFLTVDAFAKLADVYVYPPKYFGRKPSFKRISKAEVIFCPSDRLENFLLTYKGEITPKVIISGNSDFEFHSIPNHVPASVKMLLLQNSFISDNKKIFTMPIGVENFRFGVNGNPKLFRYSPIPQEARGRLLLGPFSNTHPIREKLKKELTHYPDNWLYLHERIKPHRYRDLIKSHFEYVASVRGNGVDTHRLWETLYRGRKVIVQWDNWIASLPFLHPYIKRISTWSETEISDSMKTQINDFKPADIPELWMPYWKDFVKNFRS